MARRNMSDHEAKTVDAIAEVFRQAIGILQDRGCPSLPMEMDAMDRLLDFVMMLGPEGLADVLTVAQCEVHQGEALTVGELEQIVRWRLGQVPDQAVAN